MNFVIRNAGVFLPLALALLAAPPELISRRGVPGATIRTAAGASSDASFSGHGRYVVFSSDAPDLAANDANGAKLDVFRRDLVSGQTELISLLPGESAAPPAHAYAGSLADDGLTVAFLSEGATAGDANAAADVFVRRLPGEAGGAAVTELVSVRAAGEGPGNGGVNAALISGDGRWVLFESTASDLVAGEDTNRVADIFLRDLEAQTTVRLSRRAAGEQAGNGASHDPVMSRDASVVAFRSDATDLTPAETGNVTDLYLWSRSDGSLRRLVVPGTPLATNRLPVRVMNPVLSPEGRYLAFRTATGISASDANGVWWHDLEAGTNALASAGLTVAAAVGLDDASGPVMSADGRTIAFEALVNTSQPKVHLWRADSGVHTMESLMQTVPPTGGEPATSEAPVLSADGSQLAFLTFGAVPGTDIIADGEYRLVVRTLATGWSYAPPVGPNDFAYDLPFPEFSPDGTRLLFQTEMMLGREADENETFDVFVVEPATGALTLVSAASGTPSVVTPNGFSSVLGQGLSPDGRFVVFASLADNVVTGDTNGFRDVFRHDRQTGQTVPVSHGPAGENANGNSTPIQVSSGGRFVLFASHARNLVANDTNSLEDIFLADFEAGTTVLVSAKDEGDGSSQTTGSNQALLSADGQRVLFVSGAHDLVAGMTGGITGNNVFLRDVAARRTRLLSRDTVGGLTGIQNRVLQVAFTDSGRLAGFVAGPSNQRDIYLYDAATESLRRLTTNQSVASLALAPDGTRLAYISPAGGLARPLTVLDLATEQSSVPLQFATTMTVEPFRFTRDGYRLLFVTSEALPAERTGINDTNNVSDVFQLDLRANVLSLVSVGPDGQLGNAGANQPAASADGQRVVFRSAASNLAPGDANNLADVFLWEAATGRSRLLSANPATGAPANSLSTTPAIADDGRFVLFVSAASDLIAGDGNAATDVFGLTLESVTTGDSDHDGLADSWELTHFHNLDQTAGADADGDGQSNLDEFVAGTNPALATSVFRVTLNPESATGLTLTWPSQPGVSYTVETAPGLAPAEFTPLGPAVTGDGTVKAVTLLSPGEARFLRVRAQR